MPTSHDIQPRVQWYQVGTALSASTTPPVDAAIVEGAAPGDATGIHMRKTWVGKQIIIRAVLATSGGSPSMTIGVYGFIRSYTSQSGTAGTQAGAGTDGEGRWVFLDWLNDGNAITAAGNGECVPASGVLDYVEAFPETGGCFERIMPWVWASAGTGAAVTTYLGVTGG